MNGTVVVFFISCVRNHLLRFCMVRGVYMLHVVHRLTCRLLSELLCTYTDDAGMHLIPQRLLSLKNLKVEEKIICI